MSAEPFSYAVRASDIPAAGRQFHLVADAEQCRALAGRLDIVEVRSLVAEITVRPVAGQSFSVRGTLDAAVVQTDVVTLDPVDQAVSEAIDVTLMPAEREALRHRGKVVVVDVAEEAGPDLFRNGRIDLGVIVSEHLALGLDPYPRAEGTAFQGHVEDDPRKDASPFASLEGLKRRGE